MHPTSEPDPNFEPGDASTLGLDVYSEIIFQVCDIACIIILRLQSFFSPFFLYIKELEQLIFL